MEHYWLASFTPAPLPLANENQFALDQLEKLANPGNSTMHIAEQRYIWFGRPHGIVPIQLLNTLHPLPDPYPSSTR